ncbi:MAG: hypothetical protein CMM02_11160 [Rhodopirellula sp.]|nr:hypothetical protein [Rhodopirellula sp.]
MKDKSKLNRKVITNKLGNKQTVWVKTEGKGKDKKKDIHNVPRKEMLTYINKRMDEHNADVDSGDMGDLRDFLPKDKFTEKHRKQIAGYNDKDLKSLYIRVRGFGWIG